MPHETPITTVDAGRSRSPRVWIDTDLKIDRAVDADDTDHLAVEPTASAQAMLDAVKTAGHDLKEVTVDDDEISVGDVRADHPLAQEFVFRPHSADYKQVEVHFLPHSDTTQVLVKFDYRRRSKQFHSI